MTHNIFQQTPAMTAAAPSAEAARLDDEVISFATDLFSALAHPTRLRIVELLTLSERTVNEIAHELDILQPNTSQHLAILQRAGVVRVTPRGALRSYSIRAPRMNQILMLVDELRGTEHCDDQQPEQMLRGGLAFRDNRSRAAAVAAAADIDGSAGGKANGSAPARSLPPRAPGLDGHSKLHL